MHALGSTRKQFALGREHLHAKTRIAAKRGMTQRQSAAPRTRSLTERILEAFDDNVFEQHRVGQRLGVSVATLRRRLDQERQPPFRTLRARALDRAARSMLRNGYHPRDVAERLGFSDTRSFVRAFKRWNSMTPSHYARTACQRGASSRLRVGYA